MAVSKSPRRRRRRLVAILLATFAILTFVVGLVAPIEAVFAFRNRVGVWAYNQHFDRLARLTFKTMAPFGYAPAIGNLAAMTFHGLGGAPKDRTQAVFLLYKAAAQGHAPSQYNLGHVYYWGLGDREDRQRGREFWEKAAEQDDFFALLTLARYINAVREPGGKNRIQELLERAIPLSEADALFALAQLVHRTCQERDVDTCRFEEMAYLRGAAELGHTAAQMELGWMLRWYDETEGFHWSMQAAKAGDLFAMRNVGEAYFNGKGVQQDYSKAVPWIRKVATYPKKKPPFTPPRGFAALYVYDIPKYQSAVLSTIEDAQIRMGDVYLMGLGVTRDPAEAARYYQMAADAGDRRAAFKLAELYAEGNGVERDLDAARLWYALALEKGLEQAGETLAELDREKRQ